MGYVTSKKKINFNLFSVSRPVAVQVKHITGETFMLPALKQSSTIAEVKAAFRDMAGIPLDHQRLVIDGKTAEDDKTLDFYGMAAGMK